MEFDIRELYQRLFEVANGFLNLTSNFSIQKLQEHDPTVEEIAQAATLLAKVMNELADNDYSEERIALNAAQAALFMRQIAIAVRKNDQALLDEGAAKLEQFQFI